MPMTDTSETNDLQELIDRYLRSELNPEEQARFFERLKTDAALRDEYILMQRITDTLGAHAYRHTTMLAWDHEAEMEKASVEPTSRRALLRPILSMAASLALLCTLGIYLNRPSTAPDVFDTESSAVPAVRGAMAGTSVSAIVAELDDNRRTALETIDKIDAALRDTLPDDNIRPDEEEYQRELIAKRVYELRWLRISALMSLGRINEARTELEAFASQPGAHHEEAVRQLKEFEE